MTGVISRALVERSIKVAEKIISEQVYYPGEYDEFMLGITHGIFWPKTPQGLEWWANILGTFRKNVVDFAVVETIVTALRECLDHSPSTGALTSALTPHYFSHKLLPKRITNILKPRRD